MPSFRLWPSVLCSSMVPLLFACSSGSDFQEQIACPAISKPAISVSATDSVTKQPVYGITGTVVRADGYTETQTAPANFSSLAFAFETVTSTAGTYDVKVTKAGYQDWQAKDVVVTSGACGVQTVNLEAAMVPL